MKVIKCHIACNTLDYDPVADDSGIEQDYEYQPGAIMIDKIVSIYHHVRYETVIKTVDGDFYYVKESTEEIIKLIANSEIQLTSRN